MFTTGRVARALAVLTIAYAVWCQATTPPRHEYVDPGRTVLERPQEVHTPLHLETFKPCYCHPVDQVELTVDDLD